MATLVTYKFLLCLLGPDLTCGMKANDVKEITVSLLQIVCPYEFCNVVVNTRVRSGSFVVWCLKKEYIISL